MSALTLVLAALVRGFAFLCGGVLVGWFADRNHGLVAELRSAATRDFLTGLGNARAFQEAIQARCSDARPFGLLIGDADALKLVNDQGGHAAGDLALKQVAAILQAELRSEDQLARIGGDEFSVLTAVDSGEEAQAIATRLERRLLDTDCPMTFGWAVYPFDASNQIALFAIADRRLYERKPHSDTRHRPVALLRVATPEPPTRLPGRGTTASDAPAPVRVGQPAAELPLAPR